MTTLQSSVGRAGVNLRPDVVAVQGLLNARLGLLTPLRPLQLNGICDQLVIDAILAFQDRVEHLAQPSGRIEPNGSTLVALDGGPIGSLYNAALGAVQGAVGHGVQVAPAGMSYAPGPQAPLADIAVPYIGASETGNNRMGTDPRMQEIFEADNLTTSHHTDGYPWCCSFVALCVQKLIARTPAFSHVVPPRTAAVRTFHKVWAVEQQCLVFAPNSTAYEPAVGDVVIYTFSHIGIVTSVAAGNISTIEGNTNVAGSREGITVMRQVRAKSLVKAFIRLPARVAEAAAGP